MWLQIFLVKVATLQRFISYFSYKLNLSEKCIKNILFKTNSTTYQNLKIKMKIDFIISLKESHCKNLQNMSSNRFQTLPKTFPADVVQIRNCYHQSTVNKLQKTKSFRPKAENLHCLDKMKP